MAFTSDNGESGSLSKWIWPVVAVVLVAYGLLAFNAGTKVSPLFVDSSSTVASQVNEIIVQAEAGVDTRQTELAKDILPVWVNLVAWLGSSQYAHGEDGLLEVEAYYLSMPKSEQSVLGVHMMTGMLLMGFGAFQFWPAFRRKFRKLHRLGGAIYILAAVVSLSMSSYYLYVTDVQDIFNQWIFETGLWIMVFIASSSLLLAGLAIFKEQIAFHMGWQAIAFGTFLTAPIQRIYWIGMAPFSEGATFNEMNILVNVSLFAQAFLGSYLIFLMNRSGSPVRVNPPDSYFSKGFESLVEKVWGVTLVTLLVVTVAFLGAGVGLEQVASNLSDMNAAIGQWHDQVLGGFDALVFTASTVLFVVCGLGFSRDLSKLNNKAMWKSFLASGLLICAVSASWAWQLGKPNHEVSAAGTLYGYQALFMAGFLISIVWLNAKGHADMVKELLYFILLFALAPAAMWLNFVAISAVGLVPETYEIAGHGYQAACATALMVPVLVGLVRAIYSEYTRQFAVN